MMKRLVCMCMVLGCFLLILLPPASDCVPTRCCTRIGKKYNNHTRSSFGPVVLRVYDKHVVVDNGLVNVELSVPGGWISKIQYNGIKNLLETANEENNRGYWDMSRSDPHKTKNIDDRIEGTKYDVIKEDQNQVELSFKRTWNSSKGKGPPLNIDKRFVMLRGCVGFYVYGVFERLKGWPALNVSQTRAVFKLDSSLFQYMAISDDRQRVMPTAKDHENGRQLDYPEAVLLTHPHNNLLKGEVDDKYQYSSENKDSRVHGWICSDPPTGFWVITPSNEFKTAGPVKQDLTSHTGPVALSMFVSTHYAGLPLMMKFQKGEPWKKVFGPVFIYLNSVLAGENHKHKLWSDAKKRMLLETKNWPYNFPGSAEYPYSAQRGMVSGQLLVQDSYMSKSLKTASSAFVGLALPGAAGSWQRENKGYQFWTQADASGYFEITGIREGTYSLYAWVPGFIGDYKHDVNINVLPGSKIKLKNLIFHPPRNGPTLWEIGIPDRTAAEFYVPDPNPKLINRLYNRHGEKFRQYGLWNRYTDLYSHKDLVFEVGLSNYKKDWYFAQVNRNMGNKKYVPTTWKILFNLTNVDTFGNYTLQLALASATAARLQVRINNETSAPHFTTSVIGNDNTIARHGIRGLYWLFNVNIAGHLLSKTKTNTIFLTQARGLSPWRGVMYDYLRLEAPSSNVRT